MPFREVKPQTAFTAHDLGSAPFLSRGALSSTPFPRSRNGGQGEGRVTSRLSSSQRTSTKTADRNPARARCAPGGASANLQRRAAPTHSTSRWRASVPRTCHCRRCHEELHPFHSADKSPVVENPKADDAPRRAHARPASLEQREPLSSKRRADESEHKTPRAGAPSPLREEEATVPCPEHPSKDRPPPALPGRGAVRPHLRGRVSCPKSPF